MMECEQFWKNKRTFEKERIYLDLLLTLYLINMIMLVMKSDEMEGIC